MLGQMHVFFNILTLCVMLARLLYVLKSRALSFCLVYKYVLHNYINDNTT